MGTLESRILKIGCYHHIIYLFFFVAMQGASNWKPFLLLLAEWGVVWARLLIWKRKKFILFWSSMYFLWNILFWNYCFRWVIIQKIGLPMLSFATIGRHDVSQVLIFICSVFNCNSRAYQINRYFEANHQLQSCYRLKTSIIFSAQNDFPGYYKNWIFRKLKCENKVNSTLKDWNYIRLWLQ